jgi:hypothetical protein
MEQKSGNRMNEATFVNAARPLITRIILSPMMVIKQMIKTLKTLYNHRAKYLKGVIC